MAKTMYEVIKEKGNDMETIILTQEEKEKTCEVISRIIENAEYTCLMAPEFKYLTVFLKNKEKSAMENAQEILKFILEETGELKSLSVQKESIDFVIGNEFYKLWDCTAMFVQLD